MAAEKSTPSPTKPVSIWDSTRHDPELWEAVHKLQYGRAAWRSIPEYAWAPVPHELKEGLRNYLCDRMTVGGFLQAVLTDDLYKAVKRAHITSFWALKEIIDIIVMWFPSPSIGSEFNYDQWTGITEPEVSRIIQARTILDEHEAEAVLEALEKAGVDTTPPSRGLR